MSRSAGTGHALIDGLRERSKRSHQIAVELPAHVFEDFVGGWTGHRRPIRAPLDQRPVDVPDRDDTDEVGDLAAAQPVWIARAIEILVVMKDHVEHFRMDTRDVA